MKIVKKIFSIPLIGFLLFFAVNVLALDAPSYVNVEQIADDSIKITWGTVSGASTYFVEREDNGSGTWNLLTGTASNSYTDNGAYNFGTFKYRVIASDALGVGIPSSPTVSASITTAPIAPPPTEICDNGIDDGNGNPLVDCADPACLGTPECSGGGTHRPSGDLFPIIQCGYNCPGIFPGDPDADCCTLCDAFETISRIINIILMFGFILGGMFLVVAGIIMYAGGASSGLLNKSKTIIKGVIYGLVIMLVSYLIVFTIIHFLSAGNADTLFSIKNGGFVIECTP